MLSRGDYCPMHSTMCRGIGLVGWIDKHSLIFWICVALMTEAITTAEAATAAEVESAGTYPAKHTSAWCPQTQTPTPTSKRLHTISPTMPHNVSSHECQVHTLQLLVPRNADLSSTSQLNNVEGISRRSMLSRVRQVLVQPLPGVVLAGSIGAMPAVSTTTTTTATTTRITTTSTTTMTMPTAMTTATRQRRRPPPHDHRESDKEKDGDRSNEEYKGNNDEEDVDGEDDADVIVVNSTKR